MNAITDALWTLYWLARMLLEIALEEAALLRKRVRSGLHVRSAHSLRHSERSDSSPAVGAPSRAPIHEAATFGERLADAVAAAMGSWRFIIAQTLLVVVWMLANLWLLSRPFDPYPFILLNLAFSTQAAYAAPLIQMSQNRQATKDRVRDDHEAAEVDLMTRQLALLETINRQQLEILHRLHGGHEDASDGEAPTAPALATIQLPALPHLAHPAETARASSTLPGTRRRRHGSDAGAR